MEVCYMKKIVSIIIAVIFMIGCLCACGTVENQKEKKKTENSSDKIHIVTTIFPEYDWVLNILGENPGHAEVTMLLDSGVDLHSYQPTADDIQKISACDMFVYVGGESDEWVKDALKQASNKNMVVVNLLDILGDNAKEEKVVEGMEAEEEDEKEEKEETKEEKPEYDEHVWLSLRNAAALDGTLSDKLQSIDPENAEVYKKNTKDYVRKLNSLDKQYQKAVSRADVKTLLFGDRFPFRYLTDDYGLDYYAAFVGCSAETEASFETVSFLAKKVDELSLHSVMTIEGTDHRIAETIIRNTKKKDQQILTMDSMQSVTAKDVNQGVTYLSVMEKNLSVLKKALKKEAD